MHTYKLICSVIKHVISVTSLELHNPHPGPKLTNDVVCLHPGANIIMIRFSLIKRTYKNDINTQ